MQGASDNYHGQLIALGYPYVRLDAYSVPGNLVNPYVEYLQENVLRE